MSRHGTRCFVSGCAQAGDKRCEYVDREGRLCLTDWCDEHRTEIENHTYCRRHGGIITLIGHLPIGEWPSLDTRAPALVAWVAFDLDGGIQEILTRVGAGHGDAEILQQPLARTGSIWHFSWHLNISGRVTRRVAVEVDERSDTAAMVTVDGATVATAVPPWITRREEGKWVPDYQDQEERAAFYAGLQSKVARALR